ncbi:unnamed protein product [Didymodactylos carnosus]|uniref:Uncharacterized protein n=1 Tax=Didymodactylos carnosus TaxID=1234261 RepID=A0A813PX97_9BILA|nr:unnamed protein product [Didymodactylos carnosus]CAF3538045.1 unnamed protein product [Didymodactylos carnosus]
MASKDPIKKPSPKSSHPTPKFQTADDDFDTDPSYVNDVDEKQQRYGSQTVPGSGHTDHVDFESVQEKMKTASNQTKTSYQAKNPNSGYGGTYGTEKTMDKNAVDYTYRSETEKHGSQKDSTKGYGGKFNVQQNTQDKSQIEQTEKQPPQKDRNMTKNIVEKHSSTVSAQPVSSNESVKTIAEKHSSTISPQPMSGSEGVKNIRARFENIKKEQAADTDKRVAEERAKRNNKTESEKTTSSPSTPPVVTSFVSTESSHKQASSPSRQEVKEDDTNKNVETVQEETVVQKPTEQSQIVQTNNKEEVKPQFIGSMDISGLKLRQRRDSSDEDQESTDEEWENEMGNNKKKTNQKQEKNHSLSPPPVSKQQEEKEYQKEESVLSVAIIEYCEKFTDFTF